MHAPITASTTVAELVDYWLAQLRADGRLEGTTVNEYERVLRRLVAPNLGSLRLDELTTDSINAVLADLGTQSVNRQRKAKGRDWSDARRRRRAQRAHVEPRAGIAEHQPPQGRATRAHARRAGQGPRGGARVDDCGSARPKSSGDMADIIDLMLATGARIGEVLALRWPDIDLDAKTVEIDATIKTETGMGTYRKGLATTRTVELPEFAITMLRRRRSTLTADEVDAVFPTRNGTWQQVNNVERRWRQIREEAGLEWVTPHAFRHRADDFHHQGVGEGNPQHQHPM